VFNPPPEVVRFEHPLSLVFFALLGLGCGLLARFLFAVYFRAERFFKRFPLWLATAMGGLCTGLLGLAIPSVVGTGYGWAQFAIAQQVDLLPPIMLLGAAIAEIFAASWTLGSGNSGGVFGPCVVTGGMFGGACGYAAHYFFPSVVEHPGNFAIVGMVAFFAAAAKAPISTIIMISEMTGGYGLLAPAMFAVVTAFIFSGRKTIFPGQVRSRLDSQFHADEFEPIVLRRVKAGDVMIHLPVCVNANASVGEAVGLMGDYGLASLPVVDSNRLCGRITLLASHRLPDGQRQTTRVRDVMSTQSSLAYPDEDLFTILKRFAANDVGNLPVVARERPDCPIGLVTRSALWQAIESAKEHRVEKNNRAETQSP